MLKRIEVSFEGSDVRYLPLHVEVGEAPNDGPPDVIRMGDGSIFVLIGKPLDGRKDHYSYRLASVHDMENVFVALEGDAAWTNPDKE